MLQRHEGLIERVESLPEPGSAAKPQPIDPAAYERGRVLVRIHGEEDRAATLMREMVLADVDVIALTRVRSDLEDVYQSIGRDEVS